jgi:lipopolysaccharide transport system permease protein
MDSSTKLSVITPRKSLFDLTPDEIWYYRDLFVLFIKRDITVTYKQTILGPLWFFIQPLLTTLMFLLVFGRIAGISTGGVPPILFYMGGITVWNYFSDCFGFTSDTFVKNAGLFEFVIRKFIGLQIKTRNSDLITIQKINLVGIV